MSPREFVPAGAEMKKGQIILVKAYIYDIIQTIRALCGITVYKSGHR